MNKEIQKLQEEIKERMDKIEKLLEPSDYELTELSYEENKRISEIQRIQRKIIDITKFVRGDWRPDWKDADQEKCYINFDHLYKTMEVSYSYRYQKLTNKMYFSREHANKALELINKHLSKEEIETYYGGK